MWLHKSQKEGNNHFPRPAGSALINAIQYPLAFIVHAPTRAQTYLATAFVFELLLADRYLFFTFLMLPRI